MLFEHEVDTDMTLWGITKEHVIRLSLRRYGPAASRC